MNKRKLNTVQYFHILREILFEIFLEDINNKNDFEKIKNKFLNEYTDYQILFLTKFGKLPKAKYSFLGEQFLIENLRVFLIKNCDILDESMGSENTNILLDSLIPLGHYNLSSSSKFLEEIKNNKNLLITEQVVKNRSEPQKKEAPKYVWRTDPKTEEKILVDLKTEKIVKRVNKNTSTQELEKIMNKTMRYAGAAMSAQMLYGFGKSVIKGGSKLASSRPMTAIYDYAKKAGTSAVTAGRFLASKVGTANLGYAALAAALFYGATKTYKNYMTKEGKACRDYHGEQKQQCIRNYRANAIRAEISDLKSSMNTCNKTSNPVKCKMVIQNKIKQLQNKLVDIQ